MTSIYLDHAAATPLHPEVLQRMIPYMTEHYGNPSSLHRFGQASRSAITEARDRIARLLGGDRRGVIFTSGGTESDNLALFGVIGDVAKRKHVITTTIEHHAVLHACQHLEELGHDITYVPVDPAGLIDWDRLEQAIRPDTALISVMYVNNEVGTMQPIARIAELARARNILLHVDAVQALGSEPIDMKALGIDLLSVSAHKINGPKGVGALLCSPRALAKLVPQLYGGSQERKRRAGTENVAGIVGFAEALTIATEQREQKRRHMEVLRARFLQKLSESVTGLVVNGHQIERAAHILNISFRGVSTETLLMNLDLAGIAAASGSACTSGSLELSHVLKAMHLPADIAGSAVRFSFGLGTTAEQIDEAAQVIATIVNRLRTKE